MPNDVIQEQIRYYKARAAEYDEWFYRKGRYDYGSDRNGVWFKEAQEVFDAFDALTVSGEVLELASGTGIWTERLVRSAVHVTAVEASPEMVALNKAKLGSDASRVSYEIADIFTWRPGRRYDAVIFSFWISHVPATRLDDFLSMVASCLDEGGKVFFVDGRREPTVTAADQVMPELNTELMTRRLNDGREFQIIKNHYQPGDLARRFAEQGLSVDVRETATNFIFGFGCKEEATRP